MATRVHRISSLCKDINDQFALIKETIDALNEIVNEPEDDIIHKLDILEDMSKMYMDMPEWGFSPIRAAIFKCLRYDRLMGFDMLSIMVEEIHPTGRFPSYATAHTHISQMRRVLYEKKADVQIESIRGTGWRLTKDAKIIKSINAVFEKKDAKKKSK